MTRTNDWVEAFFADWQRESQGKTTPFYEVLAELDPATPIPTAESLIGLLPQNDTDEKLILLWQAWTSFMRGVEDEGIRTLEVLGKRLPGAPEPKLLRACAALMQADKKTAHTILSEVQANGTGPTASVAALLARFGVRKPPPVKFLRRDNPINVTLGKARKKQ